MSDFERFSSIVEQANFDKGIPNQLLMRESGNLSTYYAPFDYVNLEARIVICGITPGLKQAMLALREAKSQLAAGATLEVAWRKAKETASFGGPMRINLIRMLDHIGIQKYLGIGSASDLFSEASNLVHYTSALRYPVFLSGMNYNGTPKMTIHPDLRWQLEEHLSQELGSLPNTVVVPLGPKVEEALDYLARRGKLSRDRVLAGMPHPSGTNAERIAYFLEQKPRAELSSKTNPEKIEHARTALLERVARLGI